VIGRFLEHPRAFYFSNDGQPELFCASADWMERNFFRRVEVAFPILDPVCRERIIEDLDVYLHDDTHAWILGTDNRYQHSVMPGTDAINAQALLTARYAVTTSFNLAP
ncbi:MAG: RNA degradosome polyphosphate kinase, partial [Steroidobacteraceae bacterium]